MTDVGLGTVRQVWFAKLADPSTKWSFLIRDDTYAKVGAQFGRSIRLGEPVDLGPNSTWVQTSWEGGEDQEVWNDPQMYKEGNCDVNSKTGKIRMWPGWSVLYYDADDSHFDSFAMTRGQVGTFFGGVSSPLWFGERDFYNTKSVADSTAFKIRHHDILTGATTTLSAGYNNVRELFAYLDDSTFQDSIGVTTAADAPHAGADPGKIFIIKESDDSYAQETTANVPTGHFYPHGVSFFNRDTYFNVETQMAKFRYDFLTGAWTNVGNLLRSRSLPGSAVWNSRVWFGEVKGGNRSSIYVTDGITLAKAFEIPDEFHITMLHVHYGALYISGYRPSTDGGVLSTIGQIWRYTGTTLSKLYEEGDGQDGFNHNIYSMCSWGPCLVWGRPANPLTGMRAGIKMWNAETDAIFDGPTISVDPANDEGMLVPDVMEYEGSVVASFFDQHDFGTGEEHYKAIMRVRPENFIRSDFSNSDPDATLVFFSFGWDRVLSPSGLDKEQYVLSSVYTGTPDVETEVKTWLNAKLRVKLADDTSAVRLEVFLDESDTGTTVGTVTGDGVTTDWQVVEFPLVGGDDEYLQSHSIQYKIVLINSEGADFNASSNPQVDSIAIGWKVAPTVRRQWQLRVVTQDDQLQLPTLAAGFDADGVANTLTTSAALVAKLEELWGDGKPVLFWDADVYGDAPAGAGTEVNVTDFATAGYRVESDSGAVLQEVGLTLVENV